MQAQRHESSPELPLHALDILQCPMDRLHPVSHVKFAEQVVNVRLHRMRAHAERAGNVIIAVAADEKFESIDLLPGQESRLSRESTLVCAGLLPVSKQHFSRKPALAIENRSDAFDKVFLCSLTAEDALDSGARNDLLEAHALIGIDKRDVTDRRTRGKGLQAHIEVWRRDAFNVEQRKHIRVNGWTAEFFD